MKSNNSEPTDRNLIDSYQELTKLLLGALRYMTLTHDPKHPDHADCSDEERVVACENARALINQIAQG